MFYACYPIPEEKGSCILYCDPDDCLFLDEEKCECIKDFECIYDKYFPEVDLGDYECGAWDGGIWCSALTGDSIKIWESLYAYDTIHNDTIFNPSIFEWYFSTWNFPAGLYQYRVDHVYKFCGDDPICSWDPGLYSWKFDNLINPSKIIYHRIKYILPMTQNDYEITIIKLNQDTLITAWYDGNFTGWTLLVPYDP